MKELVEVIAKALVDNPDEVVVTETVKEKAIVLELKVADRKSTRLNSSHRSQSRMPSSA